MNSTKSIFITLSKVFLLFAFIGFFLPFTQEALWGGFSGEESITGLGFLLVGTKFSALYSLFLCSILCLASIFYSAVIYVRNNKDLNSESVALDFAFIVFAIYSFIISFYLCQDHRYGTGIGAIFMLVGLGLSFVFLVCASVSDTSTLENSCNAKAVFLIAPITILLSAFFMLVCQGCFLSRGDWKTMIPGVLATLWFCFFKFTCEKKGKTIANNSYIIPLLALNLLTSIGWGLIRYGSGFVEKVLTGEGVKFFGGAGKYYLFFLVLSEFILLVPLFMNSGFENRGK